MTDARPSSEPPARAPAARRILIIKPSSLGDVIHALPVLAALRAARPHAHIAWLLSNSFVPLLEHHPLLDQVIPFDRARYGRIWRSPSALGAFWQFVARLRREHFDLVVDLQGLVRSGLLGVLGGVPHRLGFADAREGAWLFYSRRVRVPAQCSHAVDRNLHLVRSLGIGSGPARFPLAITPAERNAARRLLARAGGATPFTAVIPGTRWESKRWPAERVAALIDRLCEAGLGPCVLLGSPADRARADAVCAACSAPVVDLVGRTSLRELTALIEAAARVVCQDSGPMHIAAALGKPTVAVFGPTNPRRTGPYSSAAVVVRQELPCMPCYRRTCPLGHHDCMKRLDVARVFEQVATLARPPAAPSCASHR